MKIPTAKNFPSFDVETHIPTCNKYVVQCGLTVHGKNDFILTSRSSKLLGEECQRIKYYGSDSSEYRNSNHCDSVHAEVALLLKSDFIMDKYYHDSFDLYVTAHPCYQCMKAICYFSMIHSNCIKEIHYITPEVDKETRELADQHNIKLIEYQGDRKDY